MFTKAELVCIIRALNTQEEEFHKRATNARCAGDESLREQNERLFNRHMDAAEAACDVRAKCVQLASELP